MNPIRAWAGCALLLLCGTWCAAADRVEAVLDGFVAAVEANAEYPAEAKTRALKLVADLRPDPQARAVAATEALRELSPAFREGLEALANDQLPAAVEKLQPLSKSADRYLAAEASFYLARALILQEKFEPAHERLVAVTGPEANFTPLSAEALFLRGLCEVAQLKRKEALVSLEEFLKLAVDAPQRLRIAAWRQAEQLKVVKDGSLGDVWLHMDFVRRKLSQEDPGPQTRKRQDDVIAMLDKLIEEAEQRECDCQGQGQGQGQGRGQAQGQGQGKKSGGQGGGPDGQKNDKSGDNDLTPFGAQAQRQYKGPASAWSMLRDKERERVFHALDGKYPARYKQLIEQYYKTVQAEE